LQIQTLLNGSREALKNMSVAKSIPRLYNEAEGKPGLMTLDELCAYISVNKSWVYQHIRSEKIPHLKLCGLLRFRKEQIDQWLESQEVQIGGNKETKRKRSGLVSRR
jgi:excisionase family DNA binding protein